MERNKKILFVVVLFGVLYGIFEASCLVTLKILDKYKDIQYAPINDRTLSKSQQEVLDRIIEKKTTYFKFDPDVGWNIKENSFEGSRFVRSNSQGLRSDVEYSFQKPFGKLRILSFGDSFVHGDGVKNDSTWQSFLEDYPNIEALNFGVSGWGLDQAYLRYLRDGVKYEADIVLICFMAENIRRHEMVYWPYYVHYLSRAEVKQVLPKPRFRIKDEKLVLVDPVLKNLNDVRKFRNDPQDYLLQMGKNDYYYQISYTKHFFDFLPSVRLRKIFFSDIFKVGDDIINKDGLYNEKSESYEITTKIIDSFIAEVRSKGSLPIVIVFPMSEDIENLRAGKPKRYEPLLKFLKNSNYHYIDIMDPITKHMSGLHLNKIIQGHYSPRTNKLVADEILQYVLKLISSLKRTNK